MFRLLFIPVYFLCATAFAGAPAFETNTANSDACLLLAMGPDPGGHTGAGVTAETTKTDRPGVDEARKAASGAAVENNPPANPASSKQSGATSKPAN